MILNILEKEPSVAKEQMNRRMHIMRGRAPYLIPVLLGILMGIIAFLKPFNPSLEKLQSPRSTESSRYHMNYDIVVSNTRNEGTVRGNLTFPLPASRYPFQMVEALAVDPSPLSIRGDEQGNVIAVLPLDIGEKEQKVVRLSFDITLFHVSYKLSSLSGDLGIPAGTSSYLLSEGPFDAGNSEIQHIVNRLAEREPNRFYRAIRLYDMLLGDFAFDEKLEPRPIDVLLKEKKLQCCDANILFASLCRATGIPAQFISGIYVSSRYLLFPQTHAWVQLYFPHTGWVPIDPTLGRFDSRSRYLCLGDQRQFYIEMWRGYTDLAYFQPAEGSPKPVIQLGMDVYPDTSYKRPQWSQAELRRLWVRDVPPATVSETYNLTAFNYFSEGLGLEQRNDLKGAYGLYVKAVQESPKFIRAQKRLIALAYAMKKGEILKRNYDEMAARDPKDTILRYCRALCLLCEGWYSEAESEFRGCERDGLTSTELYASLGYLYQQTKQIDRAEESYALGLKAAGDHFTIYLNLLSMFQDAEDWAKMNYWAGEGLKEFPDNHIFQGQMGYGLIRIGEPRKALSIVKRASAKDPGMGWYHALMGWAYRDMGDREQAKRELRDGLKMNRGIGNKKFYEDMLREVEQ